MGDYCCEKFASEARADEGDRPPFVKDQDGKTWNIEGCCGGGCYVVTEMRFCPYCGAKLAKANG